MTTEGSYISNPCLGHFWVHGEPEGAVMIEVPSTTSWLEMGAYADLRWVLCQVNLVVVVAPRTPREVIYLIPAKDVWEVLRTTTVDGVEVLLGNPAYWALEKYRRAAEFASADAPPMLS